MANGKREFDPDRAIPVKAVSYDEASGELGMLPVGNAPEDVVFVRDDGESFPTHRGSGGWRYASVDGWSQYCMATN